MGTKKTRRPAREAAKKAVKGKSAKRTAKKTAAAKVAPSRSRLAAVPSSVAASAAKAPAAARRTLAALVGTRAPMQFVDSGLERMVLNQSKLFRRVESMAREVTFSVAIQTPTGERLQETRGQLAGRSLADLRPSAYACDHSEERLRRLGFTIVRRGRFALSVRGPLQLVAEITKSQFVVASRPRFPVQRSTRLFSEATVEPLPEDLYLAPAESLTVSMKGVVAETIDDFVFVPPPLYFEPPSATAPALAYHTAALAEIAGILKVPAGSSGLGIRVAVIDTGFADHPYYQQLGLQVTTPGLNPRVDTHGHGTAVTANVFAVAPDADVYLFQQSDPPQDALEIAVENGARVLSCSWGWDHEQSFPILEATVRDLIDEGVVGLFGAGHGPPAGARPRGAGRWVGGGYRDANGQLEASSYASGFVSSLYPNPPRRVPDFCGLCGQSPRGIYIPMPCPPGSEMDRRYGGTSFPEHDETGKTDGWVVASGTSGATPQIAGVVALLLREAAAQGKNMAPATVKSLLEQSAQAISQGRNVFGFPASGQPNTACGWGLVDAGAALASIAALP